MATRAQIAMRTASTAPYKSSPVGLLQRKCTCGQQTSTEDECTECRKRAEGSLQRSALSSEALDAIPSIVHEALDAPGQPLDPVTRTFMESHFGHDFSQVRVHTDAWAAEAARAVHARAYTVGRHLVFGRGYYAPATGEGTRLLAHELTHVVQQAGTRSVGDKRPLAHDLQRSFEREAEIVAHQIAAGGSAVVQQSVAEPRLQRDDTGNQPSTGLASYPEEERRRVRVLTTRLSDQWARQIETFFTPGQGGAAPPSVAPPKGIKVEIAGGIAQNLHAGLTSVAASLVTPATAGTDAFLPRHATISLAINPANAIFRFTRIDQPAPAAPQQTAATAPQEVVVVEFVGAIKALPSAAPGEGSAELRAESFKIRTIGFKRGSGWQSDQWALVVTALETLPDAVLKGIAGLTFLRAPKKECKQEDIDAGTCDPTLAGETDVIKHTITIFDNAFVLSGTRFGLATELARVIAHEVGHAADYVPLKAAWTTFAKAGQPSSGVKTLLAARARSGSRFEKQEQGGKTVYMRVPAGADTSGAFREAAIKDGVQVDTTGKITAGGITTYAEKSWEELFADSFAIYIVDPELLRTLKPQIHAYFTQTYPMETKP